MRLRGVLGPVAAAVAAVAVLSSPAWGRIKLATLPAREQVEIQLENEDATLVEEERIVTLLKGTNHVDFSWSNTHIDPHTILFRPLEVGDAVRVIHVAYPPNENALVWEVYADKAGPVRVRISYLIRNLRRTFHYRATAEHDESNLTLRDYLRVWNFSGEEFGTAGVWAGFGEHFRKEMGLQESKQMLLAKFTEVPIQKKFIFNWLTGRPVPDEPNQRYATMHYVLKNDEANHLGEFPLPYGKVRIFQKDGHGGEAFTGEDWGEFTPIDDEMKLYLGLARDVRVERTIERAHREQVHGALHNLDVVIKYEIQNFKKDACTLDIEEDVKAVRDRAWRGSDRTVEWSIEPRTTDKAKVERKSAQNVEIHIPLPARPADPDTEPQKITFLLHLQIKNEW